MLYGQTDIFFYIVALLLKIQLLLYLQIYNCTSCCTVWYEFMVLLFHSIQIIIRYIYLYHERLNNNQLFLEWSESSGWIFSRHFASTANYATAKNLRTPQYVSQPTILFLFDNLECHITLTNKSTFAISLIWHPDHKTISIV